MRKVTGKALLIWATGFWLGVCTTVMVTPQPKPQPQQNPLPSIAEIQERVGAKPDGILGPETQAKWDRAYCDSMAVLDFREASE